MACAKITFWGVRGSIATPGRSTARVGGNTACLEIKTGKALIICDAGTGIRPLGLSLARRFGEKPIAAHLLLSHLHWDHYIGLPFFKPLYSKKNRFTIAGPKGGRLGFGAALSRVVNPPFFPVPFSMIPAGLKFRTLPEGCFRIGDVEVNAKALNHPGGSFGWRFSFKDGRSLVYVTDNEPVKGPELRRTIEWIDGADILIHDAQYSPETYPCHRGWGHSPFTYPIELAKEAGVKKLFLFHFDPGDDDRHLGRVLKKARAIARRSQPALAVELAKEGLSFTL
ncbi:MAG: MBL fold metallo-hydrolase [Pseudomonadota bacterium]